MTNPLSLRINYTKQFNSIWFQKYGYSKLLQHDLHIRRYIKDLLDFRFNDLVIKRNLNFIYLIIYINPPFNKNSEICLLVFKKQILSKLGINVKIKIKQVAYFKFNNNSLKKVIIKDSTKLCNLVSNYISYLMTIRMPYNRVVNILKSILPLKTLGIKGYSIRISGPFPGYNMAQKKKIKNGSIPLSTYRTEISYSFREANTVYGTFGIKVWINLDKK